MAADMIPVTSEVSPADPSVQVISKILGADWHSMTGHNLDSAAATMARDILSSFNLVALAAVSVLFALTFTQGAIATANEGTPMGKRFSATWMPLRFAFAISALAPIIKGLSIFQAFMLLV
ncbi:MAG: hypothetical protein ACRCTY_05360, partial [Candidatus Adiutrix sp.]